MKEFNNGKLPSLNQISEGLLAEAMVQLRFTVGDMKDQQAALEAQRNIKKTWEDLLNKAKILDRGAPLTKSNKGGL